MFLRTCFSVFQMFSLNISSNTTKTSSLLLLPCTKGKKDRGIHWKDGYKINLLPYCFFLCKCLRGDVLSPRRTTVGRISSIYSRRFNRQQGKFRNINTDIYVVFPRKNIESETLIKEQALFFFLSWISLNLFWTSLSWTDLEVFSSFPLGQDFSVFAG